MSHLSYSLYFIFYTGQSIRNMVIKQPGSTSAGGSMDIQLRHIYKTFGNQEVIHDFSISLKSGCITTFLGPSGCGKTTLLRMIAGLEVPDSGEIYLGSRCVYSREQKIFVPSQHRGLGFVFQEFNLLDTFTLEDNIYLPLVLMGMSYEDMRARLLPIARELGLTELLKKHIRNYMDDSMIAQGTHGFASGDMGDISMMWPTVEIGTAGFSGTIHGKDFKTADPVQAFEIPARYFADAIEELLSDGGAAAWRIKEAFRPVMSKTDYLEKLDASIDTYEKVLTRNELVLGMLVNGSQSVLKLGLASVIIVGANLYLDVRINRMNEMEALPVQNGTTEFTPQGYDIEFRQVDFAYEQGKQILNNLSFIARQGEKTALVGPSGSGKSTAARLAARFWDIQSGKITLGGQDISRIDPETLLKNYSVVFQDVVLFNASIMDNIRIGKRDATDEEVRRVARLAQCDEFVTKMPQGYQTIIGENGETLSGGERQRISIARALLKDAPIVLLDEATASLDVENETKIQAGISELVRNKTVLIIAHRMRTVANADKIVVLENGSVAEMGTPEELKKKNGIFARMVNRQVTNMN